MRSACWPRTASPRTSACTPLSLGRRRPQAAAGEAQLQPRPHAPHRERAARLFKSAPPPSRAQPRASAPSPRRRRRRRPRRALPPSYGVRRGSRQPPLRARSPRRRSGTAAHAASEGSRHETCAGTSAPTPPWGRRCRFEVLASDPERLRKTRHKQQTYTGHRLGIQNAPAGGPLQITDHTTHKEKEFAPHAGREPRPSRCSRSRRALLLLLQQCTWTISTTSMTLRGRPLPWRPRKLR